MKFTVESQLVVELLCSSIVVVSSGTRPYTYRKSDARNKPRQHIYTNSSNAHALYYRINNILLADTSPRVIVKNYMESSASDGFRNHYCFGFCFVYIK